MTTGGMSQKSEMITVLKGIVRKEKFKAFRKL